MSRALLLALVALTLGGCRGGRDQWIADLQSNRPEQRALAVKKLADRFDEDDLVLFTQAARDPAPIVRAEAVAAIARSSDKAVLDLLGEALADVDEQVQTRAATALASFKSDKARSYLTLQYSRRGRATRQIIVQALKGANVPGAMAQVVASEANSIWERNLKTLQTGTAPERAGAAEELGRSGRPDAVNRLVPLLKDSQVVLAAAAARGLGYAGDVRAVPPVTGLLDESFPELREAACDALANLKAPAATSRLLAAALEHGPASPLAVAALVAIPRSAETDKALCEIVGSGGALEVFPAGRELRRRGGCPAEPLLEKLKSPATALPALLAVSALGTTLKDMAPRVAPLLTAADPQVRKAAADALVELGDATVAPLVLKAYDAEVKGLEPTRLDWVTTPLPRSYGRGFDPALPLPADDPAALVRMRQSDLLRKVDVLAARRLVEQGKAQVVEVPPSEVIDDAADEQLRPLGALAHAVGRLQAPGALEVLTPLAPENSPVLRAGALAGLAWCGPSGQALARAGLLDAERSVQSAAAVALAESGAPGQALVLEVIGQLVGDRSRLLDALRGVPLQKTALPTLLEVVKQGGGEAGVAAGLVADLGDRSATPALSAALEDPTCIARRELLWALGRLGAPESAEAIGRFLYSDSAEVRAAAATALAGVGGGPHLEALDALKGDYSGRVREAAATTLGKLTPEGKH